MRMIKRLLRSLVRRPPGLHYAKPLEVSLPTWEMSPEGKLCIMPHSHVTLILEDKK